jgi:hypothetical protein
MSTAWSSRWQVAPALVPASAIASRSLASAADSTVSPYSFCSMSAGSVFGSHLSCQSSRKRVPEKSPPVAAIGSRPSADVTLPIFVPMPAASIASRSFAPSSAGLPLQQQVTSAS